MNLIHSQRLIDAFVYANIPHYIFEHFSKHEKVIQLADEHSGKELAQLLAQTHKSFEENPNDIDHAVTIYALIVAAGLKANDETKHFFQAIEKNYGDLKWLNQILEIANRYQKKEIQNDVIDMAQDNAVNFENIVEFAQKYQDITSDGTMILNGISKKDFDAISFALANSSGFSQAKFGPLSKKSNTEVITI